MTIADLDPCRLEADWKVGPYGALLCAQAVLPAMRAERRGTLIFTGASASMRGSANFGSFAVCKHTHTLNTHTPLCKHTHTVNKHKHTVKHTHTVYTHTHTHTQILSLSLSHSLTLSLTHSLR